MGYVKEIVDKLLKLQDMIYKDAKEYYRIGEGKAALLRVVGSDGETLLLKCEGGKIRYAQGNESPIHIFKCSFDTFLNILSGEEDLREAMTKGHLVIENASTGTIDIVEMEKWSKAFERLRGVVRRCIIYGKLIRI